jgi:Luciferase-like monooxygenase
MRYGFVVPYADAREFAELAAVGEQHGWDGVFTWGGAVGCRRLGDARGGGHMHRADPAGHADVADPGVALEALGPRHPRRTVDRLSRGRAVMGVGLGALHSGWTAFERDEGRRVRAARLDECLAVYDGLMRGQPFAYEGTYYSVQPTDFMPPDPPVQQPRPPVWCVGAHVVGRKAQPSLDRAARWDGLLPQRIDASSRGAAITLDQLAEIVGLVRERRAAAGLADEPYDVVVEADSTGQHVRLEPGDPSAWEQAGATWWVESWWGVQPGADGRAEIERRVRAGPPGR